MQRVYLHRFYSRVILIQAGFLRDRGFKNVVATANRGESSVLAAIAERC